MNDLFKPILNRTKKAGNIAGDVMTDYFGRMFNRLDQIRDQFEAIERRTSQAGEKLTASLFTLDQGSLTDALVIAAAKELIAAYLESAEERNQLKTQLVEAKAEIDQVQAFAKSGKWDTANVQMLARTGKLFTGTDVGTVKVGLEEVELPVLQQALEQLTPIRWLELEGAFEAAREERK